MEKIIPTWGYKSDGTAEIFDLKEGENLPEGWSDRPEPQHHPNTAHLHKPSDPNWPPLGHAGHAIAKGYPEPIEQATADVAAPVLEEDDIPPRKRRGRPPLHHEES
jgi:hypothetical protein